LANPKHVEQVKQGITSWNNWRLISPTPADLSGADLHGVDLSDANELIGANLTGVDLNDANLRGQCPHRNSPWRGPDPCRFARR